MPGCAFQAKDHERHEDGDAGFGPRTPSDQDAPPSVLTSTRSMCPHPDQARPIGSCSPRRRTAASREVAARRHHERSDGLPRHALAGAVRLLTALVRGELEAVEGLGDGRDPAEPLDAAHPVPVRHQQRRIGYPCCGGSGCPFSS